MTNFSIIKSSGMQTDDKQAIFRSWVSDHSDVLYNYATKHGFDEHSAMDLVQETFLSAWRGIDNFRNQSSVRNWLFVILKNKVNDHFRKAVNNVTIESLGVAYNDHTYFDEHDHWKEGMYPREWSVNFSNPAEVKDFQSIFKGCNGKLKPIQSVVFVMKYVDDLDSESICRQLGITPNNYWVLLHRAKVQLRACLEKNWLKK